jgi:hypothetical protein
MAQAVRGSRWRPVIVVAGTAIVSENVIVSVTAACPLNTHPQASAAIAIEEITHAVSCDESKHES